VNGDDLAATRLGVLAALRDGDAALAYRMVVELLHDGTPMPVVIEEVFAPIQTEAGERWASGDVSIAEEHVATAAVETLVSLLAGALDQPVDADTVVVACAEGDDHTLPARMAAALVSYEGYRTLFLGTSVPADDLAGYLESADADVLVVSCTRPANLLGARACIAAAHSASIPVVVGGRAFGRGDHWEALGADAFAPRLSALTDVLSTWRPDPAAAEARAVPVAASTRALVGEGPTIAERLLGVLDRGDGSTAAGRVVREVCTELVDVLVVAVHLDDAALLAGQAGVLAELLAGHAGVTVTPDTLLAQLAEATGSDLPIIDAARRVARS
jgi:methanogenic corrinoid protein MtbC1